MRIDSPDIDLKRAEWDASYARRENHVFYPHEEVIRFVSRYVCRQVGWKEWEWRLPPGPRRGLAIGCGIGRHVFYMEACGLEAWGIDLSSEAVAVARQEAEARQLAEQATRFIAGSATEMPFPDGHFQVAVSHGVLDSMPFSTAREVMGEAHRVLAAGGLFYLDLVSGDDGTHGREFAGEEVVGAAHEQGTIQSYFNFSRIESLIAPWFTIREAQLIHRRNLLEPACTARYHLVLTRTNGG